MDHLYIILILYLKLKIGLFYQNEDEGEISWDFMFTWNKYLIVVDLAHYAYALHSWNRPPDVSCSVSLILTFCSLSASSTSLFTLGFPRLQEWDLLAYIFLLEIFSLISNLWVLLCKCTGFCQILHCVEWEKSFCPSRFLPPMVFLSSSLVLLQWLHGRVFCHIWLSDSLPWIFRSYLFHFVRYISSFSDMSFLFSFLSDNNFLRGLLPL